MIFITLLDHIIEQNNRIKTSAGNCQYSRFGKVIKNITYRNLELCFHCELEKNIFFLLSYSFKFNLKMKNQHLYNIDKVGYAKILFRVNGIC